MNGPAVTLDCGCYYNGLGRLEIPCGQHKRQPLASAPSAIPRHIEIRNALSAYVAAVAYLDANHTTMAERGRQLAIRDRVMRDLPTYIPDILRALYAASESL